MRRPHADNYADPEEITRVLRRDLDDYTDDRFVWDEDR
jgi:mRNA-degrading endonuclease HigB of HigAB toxin-antitoxin module